MPLRIWQCTAAIGEPEQVASFHRARSAFRDAVVAGVVPRRAAMCRYGALFRQRFLVWTNAEVVLRNCSTSGEQCDLRRQMGRHAHSAQQGSRGDQPGRPSWAAHVPLAFIYMMVFADARDDTSPARPPGSHGSLAAHRPRANTTAALPTYMAPRGISLRPSSPALAA